MSFEEEWAEARVQANASVSMRLNQVDDGNGGRGVPKKRLHVDSNVLRGRADKADTVRADFGKADNQAVKETEQVAASLKGFKSGPAFNTLKKRWEAQMKYVEGLLLNSVAGALREAAAEFDARERAEAAKHKGDGTGKAGNTPPPTRNYA